MLSPGAPRVRLLAALLAAAPAARPAAAAGLEDMLPGARAQGMGLAYTATADEPHGLLFNPAGLAGRRTPEAALSVLRDGGVEFQSSEVFAAYSRPLRAGEGRGLTMSAAAASLRNRAVRGGAEGGLDLLLLSYAGLVRGPALPNPLRWGLSTRLLRTELAGSDSMDLGFDAGVIAEGPGGLRLGLAATGLVVTGTDLDQPVLAAGLALPWERFVFALDLRRRDRRTELHPGVEASFLQGLLRVRAGKGPGQGGEGQLALGAGVDYAPIGLDLSMTVPWGGLMETGGSYQASVSYRFGGSPFYGRFVEGSSQAAARVQRELGSLEDRKTLLLQDLASAQAERAGLLAEIGKLERKLDDVRLRAVELEKKVEERAAVPVAQRERKAPEPEWPKRHKVKPGDTLRSVASEHYGDTALWERIYQANQDKVDRGLPRIGETLVIPEPR